MAGRPSLGDRRQVNVRLNRDLIERIDSARGSVSRDQWFARAAEVALKPTVQMTERELHQPRHVHGNLKLLRTEFPGGRKVRVYQCGDTDCGLEVRI